MATDPRVGLIRRSYAAFTAQDAEAMLPLYSEDCHWDFGPIPFPEQVYERHDGLRAMVAETASIFEPTHGEIELRDAGGPVLVRAWHQGRSRAAGVSAGYRYGQVIEFRGGKIRSVVQTEDPPPGWERAVPLAAAAPVGPGIS